MNTILFDTRNYFDQFFEQWKSMIQHIFLTKQHQIVHSPFYR